MNDKLWDEFWKIVRDEYWDEIRINLLERDEPEISKFREIAMLPVRKQNDFVFKLTEIQLQKDSLNESDFKNKVIDLVNEYDNCPPDCGFYDDNLSPDALLAMYYKSDVAKEIDNHRKLERFAEDLKSEFGS